VLREDVSTSPPADLLRSCSAPDRASGICWWWPTIPAFPS
jgi:hypothetical protein